MQLRTLRVSLLLLLLFPGLLLARDVYRVGGAHSTRGRWSGQLELESDPAMPSHVGVRAELDFASGPGITIQGQGLRNGNLIAVNLGGGGATTVISGQPTGPGGRLLLMLSGDLVALRADPPSGLIRGAGRLLDWSHEADLTQARAQQLLSEFGQRGDFGHFTGVDGTDIRWVAFREPQERGAIVFCNGRTETYLRYAELVHDLRGLGYSVYMIDHRGQGRSGRMLGASDPPGSPERQKGYVHHFDDYVRDLDTFMNTVVLRDPHQHLFGAGHSMGGAIISRYQLEHPGQLEALLLFSPMMQIPIKWYEKGIVDFMVLFGQGKKYAKGKGPWDPSKSSFATTESTNSPNRWRYKNEMYAADPTLWIGGPTYRWVREAFHTIKKIRKHSDQITVPVLLFQASADTTVVNAGEDEFVHNASHATKVVVAGGKHSLLLETDERRDKVLNRAIRFLDRLSLN